ncbi:hypothetical protein INP89_06970 [Haemophilus influenzae]|nr:hypothetical protein [Haemophilus influenzae]QOR26165.1 hypothetical protein INP89_06970 [Haemophilus influenzae]
MLIDQQQNPLALNHVKFIISEIAKPLTGFSIGYKFTYQKVKMTYDPKIDEVKPTDGYIPMNALAKNIRDKSKLCNIPKIILGLMLILLTCRKRNLQTAINPNSMI